MSAAVITRESAYDKVVSIMVELFELDPEQITEQSHLYDDLEVDSIDAVDLIIELKSYTGKKVSPEHFKSVRTVGDVVNAVCELMRNE